MKTCLDASRLRLASRFWSGLMLEKMKSFLCKLRQATTTGFMHGTNLVHMLSCEFQKISESLSTILNGPPELRHGTLNPEVPEKSE